MESSFWRMILAALVIVVGIGVVAGMESKLGDFLDTSTEVPKIAMRDRVDLAIRQNVEMTRDLRTGEVPTERLLIAKQYADEFRATHRAPLTVEWVERGPNNVGGRTRALMVDPNDVSGNTLWAGSVAGGLFKSTDISASNPGWTPVNDLFDNLAVTCLAYDPTNTQVMYFGTGEGYFNSDAVRGLGVWKTVDGGLNWAQLASTSNATFRYCQRIVVTSTGAVLVGTQSGLQRSADGGATWTKVLG